MFIYSCIKKLDFINFINIVENEPEINEMWGYNYIKSEQKSLITSTFQQLSDKDNQNLVSVYFLVFFERYIDIMKHDR